MLLSLSGCAVGDKDLERWERTQQGPRKLYAVATHEKYGEELRLHALESIIKMPARSGKNIALPVLIEGFHDDADDQDKPGALSALTDSTRKVMIEKLTPFLEDEMKKAPPQKKADGTKDRDPTVPVKDAAFAILANEPPLVTNEAIRTRLKQAIVNWVVADFDARLDAPQKYSVEQMFKAIGNPAVVGLPPLIREESSKVDRITALVSDLGDPETKLKSANQLVTLAKGIDSPQWIQKKTAEVKETNEKQGRKDVPEAALQNQLKAYQDQELFKIFSAMKKIAQKPVIDYLTGVAANKAASEDRRKNALAALEGHVDKTNTDLLNKLSEIAADDSTPDGVRDLAFARLGELPKDQVVPRMYKLFDAKKWKVRWIAGSLVLKSITTKGLPEFFAHLPRGGAMGMTEFFTYGGAIQTMDSGPGEPKTRDAILPYLNGKEGTPKLVALGYFYKGKKADSGLVEAQGGAKEPAPKCAKEDDCGWSCDIPKEGKPAESESKDIVTVGDFAKYCVLPSMNSK